MEAAVKFVPRERTITNAVVRMDLHWESMERGATKVRDFFECVFGKK